MPLGKVPDESHRGQSRPSDAETPLSSEWVLRLGRVGGTQIYLSSTVLFAAGAVAIAVALVTGQQGNADLPTGALIGTLFWVVGWIIQLLTQVSVARVYQLPMPRATLNLIGVEGEVRRWPAVETFMVSLSSVVVLVFGGMLYWWIDGGFQTPVFTRENPAIWAPPSMGSTSFDSMWRVGAWLSWFQAVCQLFPLPRTTGRQILVAVTRISSPRLTPHSRVLVVRACLVFLSLGTLGLAAWLMMFDTDVTVPRWPLLLLLAILLWVSSASSDLMALLSAMGPEPQRAPDTQDRDSVRRRRSSAKSSGQEHPDAAELDEPSPAWDEPDRPRERARPREPAHPRQSGRRVVRQRPPRRRARQAMSEEMQEAVDVARLDEILQRLQEVGVDGLGVEEKEILERVSAAFRRERERQDESSGGRNDEGSPEEAV